MTTELVSSTGTSQGEGPDQDAAAEVVFRSGINHSNKREKTMSFKSDRRGSASDTHLCIDGHQVRCTLHEGVAFSGSENIHGFYFFFFSGFSGPKCLFNRWFLILGGLARFFHTRNISVLSQGKSTEIKPGEPKELYDTNVCSGRLRIYLSTTRRWIRRSVPHFHHGQNARQMNACFNFQ